ncbi:hypothetical protein A1O3_02022 [Capronia epimyces CBS 606.96]|uniref:BZIP domain-containing protein n=1 Tax=Capronia epimyces CBS 606.96 TaxID=1182542 RepID=W9Y8W3_9EURO|nr:uncharacterized protein A1O3_02022 [Capronia epimyces CBS 606.96]EXJ88958.1 hypothetical protein A1O3_02022 [Capronia epimyces CBS 606.96]
MTQAFQPHPQSRTLPGEMSFLHHQHMNSQPSDTNSVSTTSPSLSGNHLSRTVQPQELHLPVMASSSSECSQSPPSGHGSIDSPATTSGYLSLDRQEELRRLSLATLDEGLGESYRPRSNPVRPRRSTTTRIKPRDDKHARELELNRKAATKCRNRQKVFVENLQERCRREERKMHLQTSLVHALHDEVVALRNEVLRQSFCTCRFVQQAVYSTVS